MYKTYFLIYPLVSSPGLFFVLESNNIEKGYYSITAMEATPEEVGQLLGGN